MDDSRFPLQSRAAIAGALLTIVTASGCGRYGNVNAAAYDSATALYSISNRKAEDKLPVMIEQIHAAKTAGDLSQQEAEWLEEIVGDARDGNWESAANASRRMMEEQVDN